MHSSPMPHRESPITISPVLAQALEDQVLDIDGDIKAIAQVPGSSQWMVAIDSGYGFCLTRLNADLSVDETFGARQDGLVYDYFDTAGFHLTAVHQVAWVDGKVLVIGATCDLDVDRIALARYHADGRPDRSFNGTGKQIVELPHSQRLPRQQRRGALNSTIFTAQVPMVMADGSIVVFFQETDTRHPGSRAFLVCLDAHGQLQPDFNQQGFARVQFEGRDIVPHGVARQGSDLLVFGATCADEDGTRLGLVARFSAQGHRDTAFNGSGFVVIGDPGTAAVISQVQVLEGGEFLAVGTFGSNVLMTRRQRDGSPAPHFNEGMPLLAALPFEVSAVKALVAWGECVLLAATSALQSSRGTLICLRSDGTPDTGFAAGAGYLMAEHESEYLALAIESDGAIVVAGYLYQQGYYAWFRRFDHPGVHRDDHCGACPPVNSDSIGDYHPGM
ncbi:hypothetical protein LZ023_10000 [Pseudomonas silvicola]|nr:hypothetical protein LZ023_10000 [Pseudomonas silvicola]